MRTTPGTVIPTQRQLVLPMLDVIASAGGAASTAVIQDSVATALRLAPAARQRRVTIGGQDHNALGHRIRWAQQHAKLAGLVEREHGAWRLTTAGQGHLTRCLPGRPLTIFVTADGCALWAMAEDAADIIDHGSVRLLLTSPPYPLNSRKAYGNVSAPAYVDWLCALIERLMPVMQTKGSLVINTGDVWCRGTPTVSTYQERLLIALQDRLGLHLCQRLLWQNTSALPVPSNYVGVERIRLKNSIENLLWLSPDPRPYADNRAILDPYSDSMRSLLDAGGAKRSKHPSGHAQRPGSFSIDNGGSIPANNFRIANSGDQAYTAACRAAGLPPHPARMPIALAHKMIAFLTQPHDLVFDPFAGSGTTARAAETLGRRWITTEAVREYIEGSRLRFAA